MVFIIAHHFAVHGGFDFPTSEISINRAWIHFLQLGGKIGVDIFVLISGYFLVTSNGFKLSKALKLWTQIVTYSIAIYVCALILGKETLGILHTPMQFLPIIGGKWWFASTYFILYILSPFINKLLKSISQKEYLALLLILTVLWCIIPTFTAITTQYSELAWFIYLYALAGYIKIYKAFTYYKAKTYLIIAASMILLTWLSSVVFDFLGLKISFFGGKSDAFFGANQLPIVIISVTMLLGFLKLDIKYNKIINIISSATFGVYLIHDSYYGRHFLWRHVFKNVEYTNSNILIPYSLFAIIAVFVLCTLLELLRKIL